MKKKNIGVFLLVIMMIAVIAGCSSSSKEKVKLAYVAWDSEIAVLM